MDKTRRARRGVLVHSKKSEAGRERETEEEDPSRTEEHRGLALDRAGGQGRSCIPRPARAALAPDSLPVLQRSLPRGWGQPAYRLFLESLERVQMPVPGELIGSSKRTATFFFSLVAARLVCVGVCGGC